MKRKVFLNLAAAALLTPVAVFAQQAEHTEAETAPAVPAPAAPAEAPAKETDEGGGRRVYAGPAVRRLARELGVDAVEDDVGAVVDWMEQFETEGGMAAAAHVYSPSESLLCHPSAASLGPSSE